MVPDHLLRFPTRAAIDALADRFDLPNSPDMQDWEWEVADEALIDEFLTAYKSGQLNDDERFTLMEMIIQSFENMGNSLHVDVRWRTVVDLLRADIMLHAHTVWYWAVPEKKDNADIWAVSSSLRQVLDEHRIELLVSS